LKKPGKTLGETPVAVFLLILKWLFFRPAAFEFSP